MIIIMFMYTHIIGLNVFRNNNIAGGEQALEDIKSYQQHVDNTEQNINQMINQSKYSQQALNPITDGANTESEYAELSHSHHSYYSWLVGSNNSEL